MSYGLSSFLQGQIDAARDYFADATSRRGYSAGDFADDAARFRKQVVDVSSEAADSAQRKLAAYGITPQMISDFAGPQMRNLQRTAMRQARRHPGSVAGAVIALGAAAVIAYAMTRKQDTPAAPTVLRR